MKASRLALFAFVLLASSFGLTQTASPGTADFAGTWTAEFHKQVWLTLSLVPENGTLAGTLTHSAQISADDEGDITKVDEEMTTDKVVQAELHGETLQLQTKDEDGSVDSYRMTLTGKDSAELRPVTPEGVSAPKPFKLKRTPAPAPAQK